MTKTNVKLRPFHFIIISITTIAIITGILIADHWNLLPHKRYSASDFGIETFYSTIDFNNDGSDDATDLVIGARLDAKNHPRYDSQYFEGGYPPDKIGVCSDVIWRAFRQAGYNLRAMVDADIASHKEDYAQIEEPDSNIDFRRVRNLQVFFDRYALSFTTDFSDIAAFQPGDIVIFGDKQHIGIVSDIRNVKGIPYIIHNGGQPVREEDYFRRTTLPLTAHYRFDAAQIQRDILIAW